MFFEQRSAAYGTFCQLGLMQRIAVHIGIVLNDLFATVHNDRHLVIGVVDNGLFFDEVRIEIEEDTELYKDLT